jgi:hypothetical protein
MRFRCLRRLRLRYRRRRQPIALDLSALSEAGIVSTASSGRRLCTNSAACSAYPLYAQGGVPAESPWALPGDTGFHLHAAALEFTHPFSGHPMRIDCLPPPILREGWRPSV